MQNQMPQEIEVWYIIPALRRELAKCMISHGLTQKEISSIMGITEAAVSQYLHSKRAKQVSFSREVQAEIKKSAERIINEEKTLMQEMMHLTRYEGVKQKTCDLHKKQDTALKDCETCFEDPIIQIK